MPTRRSNARPWAVRDSTAGSDMAPLYRQVVHTGCMILHTVPFPAGLGASSGSTVFSGNCASARGRHPACPWTRRPARTMWSVADEEDDFLAAPTLPVAFQPFLRRSPDARLAGFRPGDAP